MGNEGQARQIEMLWRCSSCRTRNLGRFVACTGCGNPKDDSEEYEMPDAPEQAASVVDPALLAMATAGENWRCRFCRSHQRRLDGACAVCGADGSDGAHTAPAGSPASPDPGLAHGLIPPGDRARSNPRWPGRSAGLIAGVVALVGVALVALVGAGAWLSAPRRPLVCARGLVGAHPIVTTAKIAGRSWEHRVVIERWQKVPHDGFAEARPAEAVEVEAQGQRQHHTERVLAGTRTEHYTERVRDGDTTESYTTSEACGQECTSIPQTCREVCSSNKNGFATCRQSCSGGGQRCTTKRCSVTKTRSVPHYSTVGRTREVPIYKDEARFAPYFRWKTWEWGVQRQIVRRGTTEPPAWPADAELSPPAPLATGEKERSSRAAWYVVSVHTVPGSETGTAANEAQTTEVRIRDEAAFVRAAALTELDVYTTRGGDCGVLTEP